MDTAPAFGFAELFRFALSDLANAVSERTGGDDAQKFARSQAAVHMIMGFLPRDVIEVMLAGHCVMLHEAMKADVHDSLRGEAGTNRRTLVALNKAFNDDLDRLERYRQRPAEGRRDVPGLPPAADVPATPDADASVPTLADAPTAPMPSAAWPAAPAGTATGPAAPELNRAARRQAARAKMHAAAAASRAASRHAAPMPPGSTRDMLPQAVQRPDGTLIDQPPGQAVNQCRANPQATTALAAGDPIRFAHALGVPTPSAAFLAAAKTAGSPFDPHASGPWPPGQPAGLRRAG